ncbi:MAG TPA: Bpu10I family restriction endonuclease [Bacteroidetes bacterium]|nr:Bpu10I family restriction endonuclease [Bacteroidota bacterium]
MNLVQEKLNVNVKKRANLFNWRGQFTPEFVEYIIESFNCTKDSIILDPFAGSGTVLIESAIKGIPSVGFEINPAAFQMANFYKYSNLELKERQEFVLNLESKLSSVLSGFNGHPLFIDTNDYRSAYKSLIDFAKHLKRICAQNELSFFMNVLFASEKDKKLTLIDSILKSFAYFRNALYGLPYTKCDIQVYHKDARQVDSLYKNQINLIITSPPYINVFNYHQNYRAVTESFDYNIFKVAHSEFGSNRKNRGNRLLTVIQYCIDMEESLFSLWNSLKEDGKLVMVVSRESNVRKTPFFNGEIVLELINEMNCFIIIDKSERAFKAYEKWIDDLNKLTSKGEKRIEEMTTLLNAYKDYLVVELITNRGSPFIKRQKGQLKLDNSVLEEFLTFLVHPDIIKNLPDAIETGSQTAFMSLSFRPTNIVSLNNKPEIVLKQKDFPMKKEVFMMRYKKQHESFPISSEVIKMFVKEIQHFINATWYDPDEALQRGSFT